MANELRIIIVFNPETGEVRLEGPLNLKGPMINTLATAIQIVVNHQPSPAPSILAPANGKEAN